MQFSGDVYVPMNVSKEADAEFMRLLEKEDPKRFENLKRNVQRVGLGAESGDHIVVGTCPACGKPILDAPFIRMPETAEHHTQEFCSRRCRDGVSADKHEKASRQRRRSRHFKVCKQCGKRFLAKRSDAEFCGRKCLYRYLRANPRPGAGPVATDSCMAPL